MITDHATFPNPTIREALCEIHFVMPGGITWDSTIYGKFFKQIQGEFPELEPITSVGLQVQIPSGEVGILPPQGRMRYKHASRNLMLQLSEGIITINVLPTYPGWAQMYADITKAWRWTNEVINPEGITRIGLRYINFIPKANKDDAPGNWFAPNDHVADAVLASQPGFLSRAEVRVTAAHRVIVTVGEAVDGEQTTFVLDIDCIEEQVSSQSLNLQPALAALHDKAWQVFSGFLTPKLTAFLEGGSS